MQDVPGAFPESSSPPTSLPTASTQQSLSQAVHARRAEYTRPHKIRISVGTWNVAAFKGTERDIGGWFVDGKGVMGQLAELKLAPSTESREQDEAADQSALDEREAVPKQEARHTRTQSTLPKGDPGSLPGGEEVGLYVLGLQEVIDINSPTEALRPYTDPGASKKFKKAVQDALPAGYTLVAEQQLIGMLLLIYAAPAVASEVKSVSTTSVGTGVMGYMGNKGAVTARLVLGETTRLVFINSHLAAGVDKGALERRNWDASQIVSRTKFDPIVDSMGATPTSGEVIGDEDFAFWFGDLNYRLEGIPGEDVRRLLMLHTRNKYDLSQRSAHKIDKELSADADITKTRVADRTSIDSNSSSRFLSATTANQPQSSLATLGASESTLDPSSDPASLLTTLSSLLPHDELHQQMDQRKAFHDGWNEGPINFLPTYKYDVGTVGMFDSSDKKRGPSWCDRILYRTRRDRLAFESKVREEEDAKRRDEDLKAKGVGEAAADEEVLYDYDPDADAADDDDDDYNEHSDDDSNVVITKAGFEDQIELEYYTAHQRVLSSDHKPLSAVFILKYDAVVPELKARIHQEVARDLDKAENEGRPSVTIVVERHHPSAPEPSDTDPATFEGVNFGNVKYGQTKRRSITIANTGRVPATINLVDRPVDKGQTAGTTPSWLGVKFDRPRAEDGSCHHGRGTCELEPGDACSVELVLRVTDPRLVKGLNEGVEILDDILVLRVENGRDHFLPVRGSWLHSSLSRSIDKLIRIPEGGIRKLQHQRPNGSRGKDAVNDDSPVKWSAPRELFRLTECVEDLVERAIAEWDMVRSHGTEGAPWELYAAWPFAEASWTLTDSNTRDKLRGQVIEALDTDTPFEAAFPREIPTTQRLEILSEVLLLFLRSLTDGVVTEAVWAKLEPKLTAYEKAKTQPSLEVQRSVVQELLSSEPYHNISFILITSMLARIDGEITSSIRSPEHMVQSRTSTSSRAGLEPPTSTRPTATLRRKTWSRQPVEHQDDRRGHLALIFSDATIRAPEVTKEKDRDSLRHRKARVLEMFLPSGADRKGQ
ncbi:inositol polyphosphate 5-phosphatase [Cryomyces antarcticus]